MSDSPDHAGEPVGAILARWRKRRKLTGQALGQRAGMSQAKISRLETGAVPPDPRDIQALAEALELPAEEIDRLVDLADRDDERLTDWRFTDGQRNIRQLEAVTTTHRIFQPAIVPDLLQTSEYARSTVRGLQAKLADSRTTDPATTVAAAVAARIERSQILMHPEKDFHFLITEAVLANRVAGSADMLSQIHRLRQVNELPNVTMRIVRADAALPVVPYHGFYLADDRWVLIDLFNTAMMSRSEQTARTYRSVFDAIESVSADEIDPLFDRYQQLYAEQLIHSTGF